MDPIPHSLQARLEMSDSTLESSSLCLEGEYGTNSDRITCVAVDESGDHVFCGTNDKTVRVYNSETYECVQVLSGHSANVVGIVSLDYGRLVSVSPGDGTVRVWNVLTGEQLALVDGVSRPKNIARLNSNTVVVSGRNLISGIALSKIQIHANGETTTRTQRNLSSGVATWQGIVPFVSLSTLSTLTSIVVKILASDQRIAALFVDYPSGFVAKVWNSQSMACLSELRFPPFTVPSVPLLALNENYLVRTSYRGLVLYDAGTMEEMQVIKLRFVPRSVQFTQDGNFIASLGRRGVLFHSVTNGTLVCRANFSTSGASTLSRFTLLPDDSLLLRTRGSGSVHRYRIRDQDATDIVSRNDSIDGEPLPPLQAGLLAVMQGTASAGERCAALITRETCEESLSEWSAAHQLLVTAVKEGTVDPSPDFNGRLYWWMEQLYATVTRFTDLSITEMDDVKKCLRDAHSLGILQSPDSVVMGVEMMNAVRSDVSALRIACINILRRVLEVEGRIDNLKAAFVAYRQCQQYAKLIGIAVNLIPIAGGAVAGVLSAGADIVSGLSVKDMVDYAFQGGGVLVTEVASTLLTPYALEALDPERRQALEQLFNEFGFTAEQLRERFHEASEEHGAIGEIVEETETDSGSSHDEGSIPGEMQGSDEEAIAHIDADRSETVTSAQNASRNSQEPLAHRQRSDAQAGGAVANGAQDGAGDMFKRPSEFREVDLRSQVSDMGPVELAGLWSAFVVRFDDEFRHDHVLVATCLHRFFEKEHLHGDDVCELSGSERCLLEESVVELLDGERAAQMSRGRRLRVKRFLRTVCVVNTEGIKQA